ncbi:MAG: glycosyltransferase family 2 protein [Acidobacteriota bacterium]
MQAAADLLVIVVNWNGRDLLPELVHSLRASCPDCPVIVADNASTDGSAAWLRREAPEVHLLELPANRGYAGGINAAIQHASELLRAGPEPNWYLLLNNDVRLNTETVPRLRRSAERFGPGIYGPRVILADRPDRTEATWGEITWGPALARFYGKEQPFQGDSEPRRVPLLLGCALLVHRKVFERCGLFDEGYFLYHEELDFLYRARRAGFPVVYCPDAFVWHRGGYSSRRQAEFKTFWTRRNTVLFLRKHRPGVAAWSRFLPAAAGSIVYSLLTLRISRARAMVAGYRAGWKAALTEPPATAPRGKPADRERTNRG